MRVNEIFSKEKLIRNLRYTNNLIERLSIGKMLIVSILTTISVSSIIYVFISSLQPVRTSAEGLTTPDNYLSYNTLKQVYKQSASGNSSGIFGGFGPAANINFTLKFAVEKNAEITPPVVEVPTSLMLSDEVKNIAGRNNVWISSKRSKITVESYSKQTGDVRYVSWIFNLKYIGNGRTYSALPLTVTVPKGYVLQSSPFPPNNTERLGQVYSWENVAPGLVPYIFRNYSKLYTQTLDASTGKSLVVSWFVNSIFISTVKMIFSLIISTLAGFVLARYQFFGKRLLIWLVVISIALPPQVIFVPNYLFFKSVDLINTPWAVILFLLTSSQVLLMKQFFQTIPEAVIDSAKTDCLNSFQVLRYVYLPLAKPTLICVAVLSLQSSWNDFFWPLVVLGSPDSSFTLPLGLLSIRNSVATTYEWGVLLAAAISSFIPVFIVFKVSKKYFEQAGMVDKIAPNQGLNISISYPKDI